MNKLQCALLFLFSLNLGCAKTESDYLPGYIEGEYIYIASSSSGTLEILKVNRGDTIKKGELLYQLELNPEKDLVEASKASLEQIESQLVYYKAQFERQKRLLEKKASDQAAYDQAFLEYQNRTQLIRFNQRQIAQAQWKLDEKTKYAPVDSRVFDVFFRVGEKVGIDQPVLALLSPAYIRVLFYVPERILSQIKIGDKIQFSCDSCADRTSATITYISPEAEFTPPVIYSKDTRDKLVYLIRANMLPEVAKQFHPGQPIDVYLHE